MWELSHNEGWVLKNDVFQLWYWRLLRVSKEMKPVNNKGNKSWIFTGKTDVEAEAPILWPPDVKSWLTGKDPDAGKDWEQEEKGATEDGMVGWHHQHNRHVFEQIPGDSEGQVSLACCSPWCHKVRQDWQNEQQQCTDCEYRLPTKGQRLLLSTTVLYWKYKRKFNSYTI